ncbi:MAG: nucleoside-diphosphate kinase, partial [Proteobacteria bacterium]|nr:nucleoside-diphosphate kinase [Pseudomonadota bacterium]
MSERTFSIIKPDAVAAGNAGNIIQMITDAGLTYKAMKLLHMSQAQA